MFPVRVGGNNKSVFAFGEAHCQFVAHLVGFLGGDLTGAKRLPYLIGDHIIFLSASCGKFVLPLGQHKFFVCGQWAALIAADQLSPVRFVRILRIVRAAFQAGRNRLALVFVQCNQTCCSHSESPPCDSQYLSHFANEHLSHLWRSNAKDMPYGAAAADPDTDNIRPAPACADRSQCSKCRWIPSCSESVPTPAC